MIADIAVRIARRILVYGILEPVELTLEWAHLRAQILVLRLERCYLRFKFFKLTVEKQYLLSLLLPHVKTHRVQNARNPAHGSFLEVEAQLPLMRITGNHAEHCDDR